MNELKEIEYLKEDIAELVSRRDDAIKRKRWALAYRLDDLIEFLCDEVDNAESRLSS